MHLTPTQRVSRASGQKDKSVGVFPFFLLAIVCMFIYIYFFKEQIKKALKKVVNPVRIRVQGEYSDQEV